VKTLWLPDDKRKKLIKEYCRARDAYYKSLREPVPVISVDRAHVIALVQAIKKNMTKAKG
jgi:hypothetical protein